MGCFVRLVISASQPHAVVALGESLREARQATGPRAEGAEDCVRGNRWSYGIEAKLLALWFLKYKTLLGIKLGCNNGDNGK